MLIATFNNFPINFRPESSFRRASLGHSPSLNIPTSSPADVTLTENEKYTMYTLKQLKRMHCFFNQLLFRQHHSDIFVKLTLNRRYVKIGENRANSENDEASSEFLQLRLALP